MCLGQFVVFHLVVIIANVLKYNKLAIKYKYINKS